MKYEKSAFCLTPHYLSFPLLSSTTTPKPGPNNYYQYKKPRNRLVSSCLLNLCLPSTSTTYISSFAPFLSCVWLCDGRENPTWELLPVSPLWSPSCFSSQVHFSASRS
ncbi:hypothetical protein OIU79_007671 [Salix purpurea]|uniref:Uncharacterized protein n=1 Tax=Salix purpurea TaxID=77065 RepID=A0A9Q0YVC5_SALPP|nr:hypothetical protein OIU79_007671 [Salix purpurea]